MMGDKLLDIYPRNNWDASFSEFLELGPLLASCSVSIPLDHLLKFSPVSAHVG